MAQINKPNLHFNTKLRSGVSSGTQANTGVGFQPDWIWDKNRASGVHAWWDAVRGNTKQLQSNSNGAETTVTQLASFDSDGFTINGGSDHGSGTNIVDWCWKAGGGQGSSNTDGSINTTYTSANTTAGFSISKYTGTGANATVGHGLGSVPKMVIAKDLNNSNSWYCYHVGIGNTHGLRLNTTDAKSDDATLWNDTTPTSSVFSIGSNTGTNRGSNPMIAYCFAEKKGFSKFGSYLGNGNADGTFIYCGFKPAMVIFKSSSTTGGWEIHDNKRDTFNPSEKRLFPHLTNAEATEDYVDFVSNGFKFRTTDATGNTSGTTYIYMAFAENPIVGSNNIPATAR